MRPTRLRILDTAERLFAERGFDGVSVREITTKAGCNVASVNYYFGNKKGLYLAVFRERMVSRARRIEDAFWRQIGGSKRPDAGMIVRTLASVFLKSPFPARERILHHKLMAREINRPTEAFEIFRSEVVMPFVNALIKLLGPYMPEGITKQDQMLYVLSIIAQVMYFHLSRNMIAGVTGRDFDDEFTDTLIDHIVRFSLHGLTGRGR